MLDSLSTQAASVPAFPHLWTSLLAFVLSMGLVVLLTWILTGHSRREKRQESNELVIMVELVEQPAMESNEEIELWRSRLEHLYLDVPAVDPRTED